MTLLTIYVRPYATAGAGHQQQRMHPQRANEPAGGVPARPVGGFTALDTAVKARQAEFTLRSFTSPNGLHSMVGHSRRRRNLIIQFNVFAFTPLTEEGGSERRRASGCATTCWSKRPTCSRRCSPTWNSSSRRCRTRRRQGLTSEPLTKLC